MARTTPVKSLLIIAGGAENGNLYIGPSDLEGAQSYHIQRRRLKLYGDRESGHAIPPEWREEGITIRGELFFEKWNRNYDRPEERRVSPQINYTLLKGKSTIELDHR